MSIPEKRCSGCTSWFQPRHQVQKYHSRECYNDHRPARLAARGCRCGGAFTPSFGRQRYCSRECAGRLAGGMPRRFSAQEFKNLHNSGATVFEVMAALGMSRQTYFRLQRELLGEVDGD